MAGENLALRSNFKEECNENGLDLQGWKIYYSYSLNENDNIKWGNFYVIKKSFDNNSPSLVDDNLPSLVAMAGFSVKSFCGTTNRIIQNLDKIKSKFKDIWVICFSEQVKEMQKVACQKRDAQNSYDPEYELNEDIGKFVDKILKSAKLTNIHLLGKCAGGGVAIHTFTKSNIYNALYLGVPASPDDVQHLLDKNLINKKFIFAWDKRDAYKFNWGLSNQEIGRYRTTMNKLGGNGNVIHLEEFGDGETDDKKFHEVPNGLFDLL